MSKEPANSALDSKLRLLAEQLGRVHRLLEHQPLQAEFQDQLASLLKRARLAERRLRIRLSRGLLSLGPQHDSVARETGGSFVSLAGIDPDSPALRPCVDAARALEDFFRSFGLTEEAEVYRKLLYDLSALAREQDLLARNSNPALSGALQNSGERDVFSGPRRISDALAACPLYFILDDSLCESRDPLRIATEALAGGIQMLQLRFKELSSARLLDLARRLRTLCTERGCLLIINDRLDIALLSGADGLHIGEEDPPLTDIKNLAPHLLVGVTARKVQSALRAQEEGADYIACGSLFGSTTKPDVTVVGLRTLQQVVTAVQVPVVGIGGVTIDNCHSVLEAGAQGFCSISPFNSRASIRNLVQDFQHRAAHGERQDPGSIHETVDTL